MQSASPFESKITFLPTNYSLTNFLIKKVDVQLKSNHYVLGSVNLVAFGLFAGVGSSIYHMVALTKFPVIGVKLLARVTVFSLPIVGSKLDEKLPSLPKGFEYSAPFIHALKVVAYVFSAIFTPIFGFALQPRVAIWLNQTLALAEKEAPISMPTIFGEVNQQLAPESPKAKKSEVNSDEEEASADSDVTEETTSIGSEAEAGKNNPEISLSEPQAQVPPIQTQVDRSSLTQQTLEDAIKRLRPVKPDDVPSSKKNGVETIFAAGFAIACKDGSSSATSSAANSALFIDPPNENSTVVSPAKTAEGSSSDPAGGTPSISSASEGKEKTPKTNPSEKSEAQKHEAQSQDASSQSLFNYLENELRLRRPGLSSSGLDSLQSSSLDLSGMLNG